MSLNPDSIRIVQWNMSLKGVAHFQRDLSLKGHQIARRGYL